MYKRQLYLVPGWIWLFAKIFAFFFIFSWVKATVPRYRYDQLMRLGWKVFLPLSLGWVVLIAFLARYQVFGTFWARWADLVPLGTAVSGG